MDSKEAREDKLEKPHTHFDRPQDIVADTALSKEEKAEALEKLEQGLGPFVVAEIGMGCAGSQDEIVIGDAH